MRKTFTTTALAVVLAAGAAHAQNVGTGAAAPDAEQYNTGTSGAYMNVSATDASSAAFGTFDGNEQNSVAVGNEALQDVRNQAAVSVSGLGTTATGAEADIDSDNRGNAISRNTMTVSGDAGENFVDNEQDALSFGNSGLQDVRNDGSVSAGFSFFGATASGAAASTTQLNTGDIVSGNSMSAGTGAIKDGEQNAQSTGNSASQAVRNDGSVAATGLLFGASVDGADASVDQTNTGDGSASNSISAVGGDSGWNTSGNDQTARSFGNTAGQTVNNFANVTATAISSSASGAASTADQTNRGDQSARNRINMGNPNGGQVNNGNDGEVDQLSVAVGNDAGQTARNTGATRAFGLNGNAAGASSVSTQLNTGNQTASNTVSASNTQRNEQAGLAFGNQTVQETRNDGITNSVSGPNASGASASVAQTNTGNQTANGTISSGNYTHNNVQSATAVGNLADSQVRNTASGIVNVD